MGGAAPPTGKDKKDDKKDKGKKGDDKGKKGEPAKVARLILFFFLFITLGLELSDTQVYEP